MKHRLIHFRLLAYYKRTVAVIWSKKLKTKPTQHFVHHELWQSQHSQIRTFRNPECGGIRAPSLRFASLHKRRKLKVLYGTESLTLNSAHQSRKKLVIII